MIKKLFCSKNIKTYILFCLFALATSFSFSYYFLDFEKISPIILLFAVFFSLLYNSIHKRVYELKALPKVMCALLSVLSSCALLSAYDTDGFFDSLTGIKSALLMMIVVLGSSILLFYLFGFLCAVSAEKSFEEEGESSLLRHFFAVWAVMFAVWFIVYLCFYPGVLTPDTYSQLHMADGTGELSNHHPVIHTLFIRLTMEITGYKPVLYMILQMLMVSSAFSYVCYWLKKKNVNKMFWYICTAFFIFSPLNIINSFTMLKDTLFSVWLLLLTLIVADIAMSKGKWLSGGNLVLTAIVFLLVMLGRSNGILVAAVVFIALIPIVKNKNRLKFCLTSAGAFAVYFIITGPVFSALNISQPEIVESLAIPLQQISGIYAQGKSISPEADSFINSILPISIIKECYNPAHADPIKFHELFNIEILNDNVGTFFKVWLSGLIKYPLLYVKAYMEETRFLWDPLVKAGNIETFTQSTYYTSITFKPVIPIGYKVISNAFNFILYSRYSVLTLPFFNTAIIYTAAVLCSIINIIKKQGYKILAAVPIFALWATLAVATPAALCGRYSYAAFICLPVIIFLTMRKGSEINE